MLDRSRTCCARRDQSSRCRLWRSQKGQAATRRQGRGKVPACGQHAPAQQKAPPHDEKPTGDGAAKHRLPVIYHFRESVASGGLASYGADQSNLFRRAATYVDGILNGDKPSGLPVQFATKFELVINLTTAKAFGLSIAETLLATADEVIQ